MQTVEVDAGADFQAQVFAALLDHTGAADQGRLGEPVVQNRLDGAQHAFVLPLGVDDPLTGSA